LSASQALSAVLRILLRVIEAHLCRSSGASAGARFRAVSFIHRFRASLNRQVHYRCCVIDGVFESVEETDDVPQSVRFRPAADLTPQALASITEQVRIRVLRWFARSGLIERDDVRDMLAWENSGLLLSPSGVRWRVQQAHQPRAVRRPGTGLRCPFPGALSLGHAARPAVRIAAVSGRR